MIREMFEGAYYILFPKPSRKYRRDRLGRFSIKQLPVIYIGSKEWKELVCQRT